LIDGATELFNTSADDRMVTDETIARFLDAVVDGNMADARALLAAEPAMAHYDVTVAACAGDADRVAGLLAEEPGSATERVGLRGWRPLLYVAYSRFHHDDPARAEGIARAAKLMIDRGADPNTSFIHPDFPDSPLPVLYVATGVTNNPSLARVLLEEGADPNDSESIYHAAEMNHRECLALLLEHGGDISSRCAPWGNTPIYFLMGHHEGTTMAILSNQGIRWLLEHGADPNVTSYDVEETPLHLASRSGRGVESVAMLLHHGADVNQRRKDGSTAYTLAVRSGNEAVAALLLEHGARDETSLTDRFVGACARGDGDAARSMLQEDGELVAKLNESDMAVLASAAGFNRIDAVKTMLDVGFDVAARGDLGATALHHAAWWGHADLVDLLLKHSPPLEIECTTYQGTPLDWAVHGSISSPNRGAAVYASIVESILAAGAKPRTGLIDAAHADVADVIRRYAAGER
jgi:ankyrin repeat protein